MDNLNREDYAMLYNDQPKVSKPWPQPLGLPWYAWIALAIAAAAIGLQSCDAKAAHPRLEGNIGLATHQLAPEGSWWYEGFDTKTKLVTGSYSLGLLWTPIKSGSWSYGGRAGYANLGTVQSWNSFPIFEDGSHRDSRVNSNCNHSNLEGCVGAYNGQGKASGYYFGPVAERDFGGGVAIGGEIGAYKYKSSWTADSVRAVETNGEPWCVFGGDWDLARGHHWTSYLGAHARWEWLQISARRYSSIKASRTDAHPDFVGMTNGPVWTVMVGVSVGL